MPRSLAVVLLLSLLIVPLAASDGPRPVQAAKTQPGAFDDADFTAPDYANGASDTLALGSAKLFTSSCHCNARIAACTGSMLFQIDSGAGFQTEASAPCSAAKGASCTYTFSKTFSTPGLHTARIFCDETAGTDFIQPAGDHVKLTVQGPACTTGETRPCPLTAGVCSGAVQTCVSGAWSACNAVGFEPQESAIDGQDNDCDGQVDERDNQLLVTGLTSASSISILQFNPSTKTFDTLWTESTPDVVSTTAGQMGDVNHDGINDFVLSRYVGDGAVTAVEVWTWDPARQTWYRLWRSATSTGIYVNEIADLDHDGKNEIYLTNQGTKAFEIWGTKETGGRDFARLATVRTCATGAAMYLKTAADLDGDGRVEAVAHCSVAGSYSDLTVHRYDPAQSAFIEVGRVTPAINTVDDAAAADLNGDGNAEAVLCGNSGASHVLDYTGAAYSIIFNAPPTPTLPTTRKNATHMNFTQACGAGDLIAGGAAEWFDIGSGLVRVFSLGAGKIWEGTWAPLETNVSLGNSYAGDVDNDGAVELLHTTRTQNTIKVWRHDPATPASFVNVYNLPTAYSSSVLIVGRLK